MVAMDEVGGDRRFQVYFDILPHIERRKYDVLTERVSLSTAQKLVLIGRLWVKAAMVRPA